MNEIMNKEVAEIDESFLAECVSNRIAENLENESAIGMYALDAFSVLTAVEARANELEDLGILSRFWSNVTGQQRKLNIHNQQDLAHAQQLAHKMLDDLYQKNAMSFELVLTLGDKVNLIEQDISISKEKINKNLGEVSNKIQGIYHDLNLFFDKVKDKIETLENEFRRNDDLLFWKETLLEHKVYKGQFYEELNDAQKIICVAKEFYEVTRGNWNSRDIAFLRSSLRALEVKPDKQIKPIDLVKQVQDDPEMLDFICSNVSFDKKLLSSNTNTPLITSLSMIDVMRTSEKHIVDTVLEFAEDQDRENVEIEFISNKALYKYSRDLKVDHNCFDIAVDLLGDFLIYDIEHKRSLLALEESVENHSNLPVENSSRDSKDGFSYAPVRFPLINTTYNLLSVYVNEGDLVSKGQPLALLQPNLFGNKSGELVFVMAVEDMKIVSINEEVGQLAIFPIFNVDKRIDEFFGVFEIASDYFSRDDVKAEIVDISFNDFDIVFSSSFGNVESMSDEELFEMHDFLSGIAKIEDLPGELANSGLVKDFSVDDINVFVKSLGVQLGEKCQGYASLSLECEQSSLPMPVGLSFSFLGTLAERNDYIVISLDSQSVAKAKDKVCSIVKSSSFPKYSS